MKIRDKNILRKIQKGDIKSFESLFHRYYPGMCLYARSLVKKDSIAEEMVQDVFYNIWKNRLNFMLTSGWHQYLFKAVYNNSMQYLRKMSRESSFEESHMNEIVSSFTDPSEVYNYEELTININRVLENLPERTGEIFRLSRFEGLSYKEIAEKLSISVKTVEANMGKALRTFRTSLQRLGYVNK